MKFFSTLTVALLMIFQSVAFAATETFSASGEYTMSDYDTPEIAEEIALDFAKQNAAEQAGIYLEGYSLSIDAQLEKDEIKTVASSKVEVLEKNISRQPQADGRILLRADIKATVDTSELDNFVKQEREKRQAAIQRYRELQEMNDKIKRDIDNLQKKIAKLKDDEPVDEISEEQERINREFLSKQKVEEFAYKPFENKELRYDITRIKYDTTLINEAIKFNPKNVSAYILQAFFVSSFPSSINVINKALLFTSDPKTSAALYALRAIPHSQKGDLKQALEDYNKAIQLDPKNHTYYKVRAAFYNRLEDFDKAEADYTTAIKLNPKDADTYKSRGELYESQKRYSEAIKDYKAILKLAPEKFDRDYNKIGDMCRELKDYPNALELYTKAINQELDPKYAFSDNRVLAYLNRAQIYMEQKEYDKVIVDCDTAIALAKSALGKSNSTGLDSLLRDSWGTIISVLEKTKQRALEAKQKILEEKTFADKYRDIDPNNIEALLERGNAYYDAYYKKGLKEEYLKQARKDYTQVLKLDPKNQLACYKRGCVYLAMKDFKSALADFNALIKLNPNYEYGYVSRGFAYEQMGDLNNALADYDKALENKPNDENTKNYRQSVLEKLHPEVYTVEFFLKQAASLRENKDYVRAIKIYTKVLERDSENQDAYFQRGLTYLDTEKYFLALKDYNKLLELNPDYDKEAYFNRAQAHRNANHYKEAIADYTKYLELAPNENDALFCRGMCYIAVKQYEKGIADYDKLIALNPNYHSHAYNNRGVAYENLGDLNKALADFDKALELDPNNDLAKNNRQRVLDKMKK